MNSDIVIVVVVVNNINTLCIEDLFMYIDFEFIIFAYLLYCALLLFFLSKFYLWRSNILN
jgi:hypothetical protein